MKFQEVRKRDYSKEIFDLEKITAAVYKAMQSTNNGTLEDATNISLEVFEVLSERSGRIVNYIPSIEEIQDVVEQKLMKSEFLDVAKCYILYRNEQAQKRKPNIFEKIQKIQVGRTLLPALVGCLKIFSLEERRINCQ